MKKLICVFICLFASVVYADNSYLAKPQDKTIKVFFERISKEKYPDRTFKFEASQNKELNDFKSFNAKLVHRDIEDLGHLVNVVDPYLFACVTDDVIIVSDLGNSCFYGK